MILAESRGHQGRSLRSDFFHFLQFLAKILPNNRFPPPHPQAWEIRDPPLMILGTLSRFVPTLNAMFEIEYIILPLAHHQ